MGTIVWIYNKDVSRYDSSLILNLDMKTSVYSWSERVLKDFSSWWTNASCLSYTAWEPDITLWQKCNDVNQYVSNDWVKFISWNMFMVSNWSAFDISLTTWWMTFCAWHKELGVWDQYRSNILRRYENDNWIGLNINQYDWVYVDVNADYWNSNHTYFGTPLLNNRIVSCWTRDKWSVKLYVNWKNVMLNGWYYKYNLSYTKPSVSSPLMIGSSSRNPDVWFFNGYMWSIHFYNRVLSDIEIQALYDVWKSN